MSNNNKISIASLAIGLGTVVIVNYVLPLIDTAFSAICSRLNVEIVSNQATAQEIAESAGLPEEKMYSPSANAIGFVDTNEMTPNEGEEYDDE